jgi:hypothetical protein
VFQGVLTIVHGRLSVLSSLLLDRSSIVPEVRRLDIPWLGHWLGPNVRGLRSVQYGIENEAAIEVLSNSTPRRRYVHRVQMHTTVSGADLVFACGSNLSSEKTWDTRRRYTLHEYFARPNQTRDVDSHEYGPYM